MGTTRIGRYLNTKGSGKSVSDYAAVHSDEGGFNRTSGKNSRLRLISGGHGQKGMLLLDKYNIKYNVVKEYSNGVRVGNIPDHRDKRKRSGTNQSWFPKSWTIKDIKRAGAHVASLKGNRHAPDGITVWGIYKGVHVGVIRTHGKIATVFPNADQSAALNRKRRK